MKLFAASIVIAAVLTACGQAATAQGAPIVSTATPAPTPAASIVISVNPFSSEKATTTVGVGTTVKFVSTEDDAKVQLAGDIRSPMFGKEGWVTTFDKAGTFHYHSAINALTGGTVVVR